MPPKQKAPIGRAATQENATITDPRFANLQTDPRYRLPSKKHSRVKLDRRFERILQDKDFSRKARVDRYGRKIEEDQRRAGLNRLYQLEDEREEKEEDEADDDADVRRELRRVEKGYDPAREGGFSTSESESESGSEEESSTDEEVDEAELAEDVVEEAQEADIPMGEVSSRLAVVNLDWDNIRAVDLMAVASSFAPPDGRIENVTIYPSEFGRERIEREELEGPPREIFANSTSRNADAASADEDASSDSDDDERIKRQLQAADAGEDFDSTALRAYQLERLRYYYAVLTCSSPGTAKALYDAMDGREYLSSANFFDLRFVPDAVSFDDDKPRDACDRVPDGYRPNEFVTDALTHSKVKLTWDADDRTRKEVQKRAFSRKEVDENDLAAYVGSDSSEGESDEGDAMNGEVEANGASSKSAKERKAAALRAALGLSAEPTSKSKSKKDDGPVGDMQITFSSGLSSAPARGSVFENEPEETTREKYIRKEKERKARRKERTRAARAGEPVDEPTSTTSTTKPAATKDASEAKDAQEDDDPFNDPFFTDPTGAAARAEAKKLRRAEKAQKRAAREKEEAAAAAQRAELELLMVEDEEAGRVRHFDLNEIAREEKAKRKGKRGKNRGKRGGEEEDGEGKREEGFAMDTKDPRFARLFERHEFAIDPTNPRFKGTEGMKALLEEGRRKRGRGGAEDEDRDEGEERGKGKRSRVEDGVEGGEDIEKLVQRVKGKAKRSAKA